MTARTGSTRCPELRRLPGLRRGPGLRRKAAATPLGALVVAAAVAVVAAACSSSPPPGSPAGTGTAPLSVPLASSSSGPATSWATLAMGHLGEPDNTFWQMLFRPVGSPSWSLATPPGVASNGGLVVSIDPSGTVTAGFEPSQNLRFSPLAQTPDRGATWSQGLLPAGLAPVPDALASSGDRHHLALLGRHGGEVVAGGNDLTTWTPLATVASLSATAAGSACRITGLTAVAFTAAGDPLVGAACGRGSHPGIFESVGGGWRSVGPTLPLPPGPTRVLRLFATPTGIAALVGSGPASAPVVSAAWDATGSTVWTVSPPLPLASGRLISTGDTPTGGLIVVSGPGTGRPTAEVVTPTGGAWLRLPALPAGTSVVAAGPAGTFQALIADQSTLLVDTSGPGGWHRTQSLEVDIQYGSSG